VRSQWYNRYWYNRNVPEKQGEKTGTSPCFVLKCISLMVSLKNLEDQVYLVSKDFPVVQVCGRDECTRQWTASYYSGQTGSAIQEPAQRRFHSGFNTFPIRIQWASNRVPVLVIMYKDYVGYLIGTGIYFPIWKKSLKAWRGWKQWVGAGAALLWAP
jgi:hypothetical protein